ncbi:MAG: hydroxyacid dehydrogenase [Rhodospirillales bacterium]|nr:hydroxyacid dehydrogenase [Rhodospirillales bacterium]
MVKLVYFEKWMDPIGLDILSAGGDITVQQLTFSEKPAVNWAQLTSAHGYQALPSTETPEEFYPGQEMLLRCPDLLAVSVSGAGYDMVDVEACTQAGVLVVNQTGANSESVAQHALGLMLSLCKQINQTDRAIHRPQRDWTRWDYTGDELTGRTLGIIGLGQIGRRLAEISKVFAMNVIAYDPYLSDADFAERGATSVSLDTLLATADFVSVHCPLTDETRGMIGDQEFRAMKPNAIFISTARGGIHDEVALESVIAGNAIAGAGVDVFVTEPPAHDHPLLKYDNVIASPHNAGVTTDCLFNMGKWSAEQWLDIIAGRRPPRYKNPDSWGRYADRYKRIMGKPVVE